MATTTDDPTQANDSGELADSAGPGQDDRKLQELLDLRSRAKAGGGEEKLQRQHDKGKLSARERLSLLLDPDTFQEVDAFARHRHSDFGMDEKRFPGDSVVTGFGKIDGRLVCVYAQDFTVLGGSFSEVAGQKVAKVLDLALESGVPIVSLNDSVGARIQEGVYSLAAYSELFWRNTQASGSVPQISVMLGPCAGGSVYSPGLTDFVIMTQGISHMFITGPEVIKTVTGEVVDFETLGGAHTHAALSGVAHLVADDEPAALQAVRRLLGYLPSNSAEPPPARQPEDHPHRMDVALNSIVPTDPSEAYDVRGVIERVFDLGTFLEIQPDFAANAVIGFARLHGQVVGVIANQPAVLAGVIDINASDKMARFIRFCDAFNIPLVTFVDSPGFLPGIAQEHGGIIRHGAKIVYAYSEATVPQLAVITRKAYGGAYIVMSSKFVRTDFVFAWPTAEIAVLGAEGAVRILHRKELEALGDRAAEEQARLEDSFKQRFSRPYAAASSGHVDDVVIPAETRPRLIAALELLRDKHVPQPRRRHGTMPL